MDGTFPVTFVNGTQGQWTDDQIYILGIAADPAGGYCYLTPAGALQPMDPADADAPGHLTRNGINYPAYSFPISAAGGFRMPATIIGGRFLISVGSPIYLTVFQDRQYAGPDPMNPADPNIDTVYGLFEFTWAYGETPFDCDISYVDGFGLPFTATLTRDVDPFDQTIGITLSREDAVSQYQASVGAPFTSLVTGTQILAPFKLFTPGSPGGDYLQPAIDAAWAQYASTPFHYDLHGVQFDGTVVDGQFRFTKNGQGAFAIDKPTTYDVLAGAYTMASGDTTELMLEAQWVAAFNRGVALDTSKWLDSTAYYPPGTLCNEYAAFLHRVSLDHLAYAFGYDDVNEQSSNLNLPGADQPPTSLTLTIGG
ncbi:beta-1,3-glucanase family protein [Mitsuaria sp. GD03876]|uniref:beta-1,3-glucanase family protein n=1 Tax=Mitsuaria sp. GD03876 TaxID=2975399 RepID=UPI002448BA63|nr:beta-1,3-glucanase family protein [Mitsuaria sp. GD03876]MDH0865594.1 beta-1,3-glucanase family protein [Mitsuaria sp. GD03876]